MRVSNAANAGGRSSRVPLSSARLSHCSSTCLVEQSRAGPERQTVLAILPIGPRVEAGPPVVPRLVLASTISSSWPQARAPALVTETACEHPRATRREPTFVKGSPHAHSGGAPQSEAALPTEPPQPLPLAPHASRRGAKN